MIRDRVQDLKSPNPPIPQSPVYIDPHPSSIHILYPSPITNHQSPITNHQSPITNHQSPITNHQSLISNHHHAHPRLPKLARRMGQSPHLGSGVAQPYAAACGGGDGRNQQTGTDVGGLPQAEPA
ncbi:hypothetical protein GC175_25330 [bacterium]|nr:hypothetical protein [bacterium]